MAVQWLVELPKKVLGSNPDWGLFVLLFVCLKTCMGQAIWRFQIVGVSVNGCLSVCLVL